MSGRRVTVERNPAAVDRVRGSFELDEFPGADEVRAAVSAQLRVAMTTLAAVIGVLIGFPLLVALLPPDGIWLTLAVQPLWVILAIVHLRRAERLER